MKMYQICMRNIHCITILAALGCITSTCARIVAPEGGPKDAQPPQLID